MSVFMLGFNFMQLKIKVPCKDVEQSSFRFSTPVSMARHPVGAPHQMATANAPHFAMVSSSQQAHPMMSTGPPVTGSMTDAMQRSVHSPGSAQVQMPPVASRTSGSPRRNSSQVHVFEISFQCYILLCWLAI